MNGMMGQGQWNNGIVEEWDGSTIIPRFQYSMISGGTVQEEC